ncbi:hypothetical protein [Nocardia brasiliensis]|uniref:hypothetical protein n=1 Tax=Nocardia brasiliensis TaxID=37326 RepID=UPI0004A6C1BD|nr:hypothetical protein [Nocardia brasiliensis]
MKLIMAVASAAAGAAVAFTGITPAVDAPAHAGPCLFGHVDARDPNSACKGSHDGSWPESEGTPAGTPKLSCSRLNDGQHVRVRHPQGGWSYFICRKHTDLIGPDYWDWDEVLGAGA